VTAASSRLADVRDQGRPQTGCRSGASSTASGLERPAASTIAPAGRRSTGAAVLSSGCSSRRQGVLRLSGRRRSILLWSSGKKPGPATPTREIIARRKNQVRKQTTASRREERFFARRGMPEMPPSTHCPRKPRPAKNPRSRRLIALATIVFTP
jgi:hypothetical protein